MGNMEVPQGQQVVKVPHSSYEFGANLISNQVCGVSWAQSHTGLIFALCFQ